MEYLINLLGAVALLIWGIRMVRNGVTRGFGSELRRLLVWASERRVSSALGGLLVTTLLQSSTATALLVTGLMSGAAAHGGFALAAMLGADLGSAVAVMLLSHRVHWLGPLLIACGVFLFLGTRRSRSLGAARALLGLGLIMLALGLIAGTASAVAQSESMFAVLSGVADDRALALLLAALLTLLMHSSVATLLVLSVFATSASLPLSLGLVMVLGVNLGASALPLMASWKASLEIRRALLANMLARTGGVAVCLLLGATLEAWLRVWSIPVGQLMVLAHVGLNLVLLTVCLPMVGPIERLACLVLPDPRGFQLEQAESYLDESALSTPSVALSCAARQALKIGDTVQGMLRASIEVLRTNDPELLERVEAQDDTVDRQYEAIKRYLTRLAREEMDREEGARVVEVLSFATNLEHIGDIIDKNLMELAGKKIRTHSSFSDAGMREIEAFHGHVLENMELALNVFMTGNLVMARRLLEQKTAIRDLERQSAERHFERIGAGRTESIDSSSLHLDVLRDFKRINSHLTAVAYPILERAGELSASRLRRSPEDRSSRENATSESRSPQDESAN